MMSLLDRLSLVAMITIGLSDRLNEISAIGMIVYIVAAIVFVRGRDIEQLIIGNKREQGGG